MKVFGSFHQRWLICVPQGCRCSSPSLLLFCSAISLRGPKVIDSEELFKLF